MKYKYDRDQCRFLLIGFLKHFMTHGTFHVAENQIGTPISDVVDGTLLHVTPQDLTVIVEGTDNPLLKRCHGLKLIDALYFAYKQRKKSAWLLSQLTLLCFHNIQRHSEDFEWPANPLHCLTRNGSRRRRANQHVRQILGSLPMHITRNQRRSGKLLAVLGFNYHHRTWADVAFCRSYILASRQQLSSGRSYGITADKSRGNGKDYLATAFMAREPKRTAWAQPVAHRK